MQLIDHSIAFTAWMPVMFNDQLRAIAVSDILKMACYPLSKQNGNETSWVKLTVKVNDEFYDTVEQRQYDVEDFSAIDLDLAKFHFLLNHAEEFMENIEQDELHEYRQAKIEFKIEISNRT